MRAAILGFLVVCGACSSGGGKSDGGTGGANGGSAGSGGNGSGGTNAGSGGAAASAGRGGAGGGVGGTAGIGAAGTGVAGTGVGPGDCTFDVQHVPSWAVGTVEIVTFSVDLPSPNYAHIDFGPAGAAPTMTAPVDLDDPMHRTVLVGMKAQKPYTFHVVATNGAETCTSADFTFTTGALPANAPKITATKMLPAAAAKGFIVTTYGLGVFGGASVPDAFIFDTDGDVVWWSPSTLGANSDAVSRARLTWDASALWVVASRSGQLMSVSIDGITTTDYRGITKDAHHDLTPLPDGAVALLLKSSAAVYSVVEMKPDGTIKSVVADVTKTLYAPGAYTNALHYYPSDDSYTMSDDSHAHFVKFKRNGTLVWQLGGKNPLGKSFQLVGLSQWIRNHGHHLTPDGRFLFFNNDGLTGTEAAAVWEVMLDETAGTATKTFEYHFTDLGRGVALGDVERLPNGNALLTHVGGLMVEVDRSGAVVESFRSNSSGFGFADFRTTLYGPPPR